MKKSLYEMIQDSPSLENKIRAGLQAETLINNDAFVGSLRKLYDYYGFLSDNVTIENKADADAQRYHYSTMRTMITDLAREIDVMITEGQNAKSTLEQQDLFKE